ncbi:MAG: hypothetical protein LBF23_01785 [Endomicrobium sp.]|jgi:hypothetical protein|nr:hypothetical protein [Endomicrobium sp.]
MGIKIGNDTFEIKGGSDWLNTGNHYCEVSAEHEVDDKERDVITLTFTSEYGAQTFRHFLHTDMCRKISIEQLGKILNYVGIENSEQLTYSSYKEFVEGFNKQMEKKPVHINIYKNKDGWNAYKLMWSRKGMSLQDDEKSAGEYK